MKKLLYEVSIIRPLVIFLLVVMHSFTMYDGGWPLPDGIHAVPAYAWLVNIISGFRIETIALIAGYVFAYQSIDLNRHYKLGEFVIKKFKRLIIPSLLFSLCYYFLFMQDVYKLGSLRFFIQLSSGIGHMWFLPMLFWCFIVLWFTDYYKIKGSLFMIMLAVLSLFNVPSLPFGISRVFHFAFYCVLGYNMYINKDKIIRHNNIKWICLMLYIILVIMYNTIATDSIIMLYLSRTIKLCLACSGIFALYIFVCNYISNINEYHPEAWIIKASGLCYGIYIIHQFVLKYLYYYTELPKLCGSYILPWVGLICTLLISIVASILILKTKIGKFLIG